MFEKLSNAIKNATDKIASAIFVDKKLIDTVIKELQRALIEADVNVILVKKISDELRQKAIDEKIKGVEKKEQIVKLLHDKLLAILGEFKELKIEKQKNKTTKILLLGLYGSGKTTTSAKLANYYNKRGLKSAILGLDVHRPAAREQLEQLGKQHNIQVYINKEEKNPIKIYEEFEKEIAKNDLLIIDTAGRHSLDADLVKEIGQIGKKIKPDYVILVLAGDIGQAAKKQASEFQSALKINGVIITRMDSTAKGGGAITACSETQAPIFFITTGEKINDLEVFNPSSFLSCLLGMGDLQTLIEKIKLVQEGDSEKLTEKLKEGKFTMLDLYEQLKSMQNIGSFDKLMDLIPGFGKAKEKISPNALKNQEANLKKWKSAIDSMTPEERENPEILEKQTSRLQRIAKGAGITTSSIRELLSQYNLLKSFIKQGKDMENLDINKLQKSNFGLSQKKLRKMAKKFRM